MLPPVAPGPVVVDIPKDVQFETAEYTPPANIRHRTYNPQVKPDIDAIREAAELIESAERPLFYTGGGVVNSGPHASHLLREIVKATNFPITSTLMGLGAYPASGDRWIGMLGMHGTYEANLAMHGCDLMIAVGARFDDRITGRIDAFSPGSKKIHIDIDASSINKNVEVDIPIIADAAHAARKPAVDLEVRRSPHPGGCHFLLVESDPGLVGTGLSRLQELRQAHQAAIRVATPLRADPRRGFLHHDRKSDSTRCGPPNSSASRNRTGG